jgi:hypothetical protein
VEVATVVGKERMGARSGIQPNKQLNTCSYVIFSNPSKILPYFSIIIACFWGTKSDKNKV